MRQELEYLANGGFGSSLQCLSSWQTFYNKDGSQSSLLPEHKQAHQWKTCSLGYPITYLSNTDQDLRIEMRMDSLIKSGFLEMDAHLMKASHLMKAALLKQRALSGHKSENNTHSC